MFKKHLPSIAIGYPGGLSFFIGVLSIFFVGCTRHHQALPQAQSCPSEYLIHRITIPGENLGIIAMWYTGDETTWRNFYIPASSGTIRRLKRGDRIFVPNRLIIRSKPLPKDFVDAHKKEAVAVAKDQPQVNSSDVVEENIPFEVEEFEDAPAEQPRELENEFIDRLVR